MPKDLHIWYKVCGTACYAILKANKTAEKLVEFAPCLRRPHGVLGHAPYETAWQWRWESGSDEATSDDDEEFSHHVNFKALTLFSETHLLFHEMRRGEKKSRLNASVSWWLDEWVPQGFADGLEDWLSFYVTLKWIRKDIFKWRKFWNLTKWIRGAVLMSWWWCVRIFSLFSTYSLATAESSAWGIF